MTNDMTKGSPIKLILSFMVPLLIKAIYFSSSIIWRIRLLSEEP